MTDIKRFRPGQASASASVKMLARDIHKWRRNAVKNVLAIGGALIEAKTKLPHGEWGKWLADEFQWSQDTAENFMNVMRVFGGADSEIVSEIDLSSLYMLAKPSTPKEARNSVLELIRDQTPPRLEDVRRIIKDAKPTPRPNTASIAV